MYLTLYTDPVQIPFPRGPMTIAQDGHNDPRAQKTIRELNAEILAAERPSGLLPPSLSLVDQRVTRDGRIETRPATSE